MASLAGRRVYHHVIVLLRLTYTIHNQKQDGWYELRGSGPHDKDNNRVIGFVM
jgi:hypothetical protein